MCRNFLPEIELSGFLDDANLQHRRCWVGKNHTFFFNIIVEAATYGCEAWTLTKVEENSWT